MRLKLKRGLAAASTLLALAGIRPQRTIPSVTVTNAPPTPRLKENFVNHRPHRSTHLKTGRGIIPVNTIRFSSDQRKRRKKNRQVHGRGFKFRYAA